MDVLHAFQFEEQKVLNLYLYLDSNQYTSLTCRGYLFDALLAAFSVLTTYISDLMCNCFSVPVDLGAFNCKSVLLYERLYHTFSGFVVRSSQSSVLFT